MVPNRWCATLVALCALSTPVRADDGLDLDEAAKLAVLHQPLLDAQSAAIRAARESAVSAAQLPDPVLSGGVTDLTLTGSERYTLRRESDTQIQLGLRQTFPGGNKRALRGARAEREADRLDAESVEQARMVAREAGMAWIDVWKAVCAQRLAHEALQALDAQLDSAGIAYRSGGGSQAALLAARVARELAADRIAGLEQEERHARNQLRRWLPADADRALDPHLPAFPEPDLAALLQTLDRHPHVTAQNRAVAVAGADLALAKAEYRPDWSAQLSYGHRPEFSDYASIEVEVGLPYFTANRQDRDVAARAAELERADAARMDWLRQHRAELQLNVEDWQRLQLRLARFDAALLPAAQARFDSARAGYAAGSGSLVSVFEARSALLDVGLQRLDLQADAARHQVNLRYFDHSPAQAADAPERP